MDEKDAVKQFVKGLSSDAKKFIKKIHNVTWLATRNDMQPDVYCLVISKALLSSEFDALIDHPESVLDEKGLRFRGYAVIEIDYNNPRIVLKTELYKR